MYEKFFGLKTRPFTAAPVVGRYFPGGTIEQARETLTRVIERAEGPGLIIGPAGTGKTLLCHKLADFFRRQYRVAMLASARLCTRRALLQNILFELKLPYRAMEEGELRLSLIDHLEPGEACPNGMLLLVDEAHNLPLRLLEELRMLTNLVRENRPRVHLVLAGSSLLEERLGSPRLESFNQRVAARCYLHPLSKRETVAYVREQVKLASGDAATVFQEAALLAIHQATDGIPRLINQVGDHALLLARTREQRPVTAAVVEEAWADLQQLPAPWSPPAEESDEGTILEFGPLGDEAPVSSSKPVRGRSEEPVIVELPHAALAAFDADEEESRLVGELDALPLGQVGTWVEPPDDENPYATENEDDYEPIARRPEIELRFDDASDPFGDGFVEEEVVIDPETARATERGLQLEQWIVPPSVHVEMHFEPDPHPIYPEVTDATAELIQPTVSVAMELKGSDAAETGDEESWVDDRDLIVIDDGLGDGLGPGGVKPKSVQRQQYRQLFASLRRR